MTTTDRSVAPAAAAEPPAKGPAREACCDPCEARRSSTFDEVWGQVRSDPYAALPTHEVGLSRFFRGLRYRLLEAGRRTIRTPDDLLPRFDKLIRPNGVCLSGTWEIDRDTPYTGLLASGAKGLIIARASVALAETRAGRVRSFGMAGKVYPTLDGARRVPSANFFVIDDNGGTTTRHFQDAEMTNRPPFSINRTSLLAAPVLAAIAVAQRLSDTHAGTRQLYPLAAAGLDDPSGARGPRFLKVRGVPGARPEADDFRDALRLALRRAPLELDVSVRDDERAPWRRVGAIELTECVASESCDHRLHFSHPAWKGEPGASAARRP
jgi:hypothetical protein